MKEKTPAMPCLKCGKVLAILGEMEPDLKVFGVDKETSNRFYNDKDGCYIVCKFCGAKNGLIPDHSRSGLPQLKLDRLIE